LVGVGFGVDLGDGLGDGLGLVVGDALGLDGGVWAGEALAVTVGAGETALADGLGRLGGGEGGTNCPSCGWASPTMSRRLTTF
jgi:hypothetical protein